MTKQIYSAISLLLLTATNIASSTRIELCELSREWGDAAFTNKENCEVRDLTLEANSFTVGGFSSGGVMTANVFSMFNEAIDGAIIASGMGPCATAGFTCPNQEVNQFSTTGIKDKPLFFYSGVNDTLVNHNLSVLTSNWFESKGANVKRQFISDFLHIFPNSVQTSRKYNPPLTCGKRNYNYAAVQNCGYSMALEGLRYILGTDLIRADDYQDLGKLWAYDQRPFHVEGSKLADQGFIYVPNSCFNQSCRLHVDFHGCTNSIVTYNDTYMRQSGYLEYAAANNIILLYPQNNDTRVTQGMYFCWRSALVDDNEHPQFVAISQIIEAFFQKDLLNEGVDAKYRKKPSILQAAQSLAQEHQSSSYFNSLSSIPGYNILSQYLSWQKTETSKQNAAAQEAIRDQFRTEINRQANEILVI